MRVTFLVECELEDISPANLLAESQAIMEDLLDTELEVISVKPWNRPSDPIVIPPGI